MDTDEKNRVYVAAADAVTKWKLEMADSRAGYHILCFRSDIGELECVGWEKGVPSAKNFEPGVFCRYPNGVVCRAEGGDAKGGAARWLAVDGPHLRDDGSNDDFREEPGDTRREEKEDSTGVDVEASGEGTDNTRTDSPLPTSPYLERRFQEFVQNARWPDGGRSVSVRDFFFAGVDAKADEITEKQLAEDLERRERWEENMSRWEEEVAWVKDQGFSKADLFEAFQAGGDAREERIFCSDGANGMVNKPEPVLPTFEVALTRMADAECSEDWNYNPQNLETDPGVITLAVLYEKPILEVARAVADRRREWVKRYLADPSPREATKSFGRAG